MAAAALHDRSLALLAAGQHTDALIVAKRALEAVRESGDNGIHSSSASAAVLAARCWLVLAEAATGLKEDECAYCMLARGHETALTELKRTSGCRSDACTAELDEVAAQLGARRLAMLALLAQPPPSWEESTVSKLSIRVLLPSTLPPRASKMESRLHVGSARRLLAVSDLHVDAPGGANMAWLQSLSDTAFKDDVLLVAGWMREAAAVHAHAYQLVSLCICVCVCVCQACLRTV